MAYGRIYAARNRVNGKVCVGQTTGTIESRWKAHMYDALKRPKYPFQRAIQKHGYESFDVRLLEECESEDALNLAEMRWIADLRSLSPNGYNCTTGGNQRKLSEETRQKISKAMTGKRNPFYGKSTILKWSSE